jgi:hypothetical protein
VIPLTRQTFIHERGRFLDPRKIEMCVPEREMGRWVKQGYLAHCNRLLKSYFLGPSTTLIYPEVL